MSRLTLVRRWHRRLRKRKSRRAAARIDSLETRTLLSAAAADVFTIDVNAEPPSLQLGPTATDGPDAAAFAGMAEVTATQFRETRAADDGPLVSAGLSYSVSGELRTGGEDGSGAAAARHGLGVGFYDFDGHRIDRIHVDRVGQAADTTLAVDLNPGDTQFVLDDATGWSDTGNAVKQNLAWFGYSDSRGVIYGDYTYTRNVLEHAWDAGAINGNVITLRQPWAGPSLAAGTAVRNAVKGLTYSPVASRGLVPLDSEDGWTRFTGEIKPARGDGVFRYDEMPPVALPSRTATS